MVSDGFIPDLALYKALFRVLGAESNDKCIRQVVKDLENLIMSCDDNECFAEASQVFSDMKFYYIQPSGDIYHRMSLVYCKMVLPEMAHHLFEQAETKGLPLHRTSICTGLIDAYGKLKQLENTESVVGRLRRTSQLFDRKVWKSLIQVYAASGCYGKARVAFNTMMRDGPSPAEIKKE